MNSDSHEFKNQRQRIRSLAALMDEMDVRPIQLGPKMREAIEVPLDGAPVEARSPVVEKFPMIGGLIPPFQLSPSIPGEKRVAANLAEGSSRTGSAIAILNGVGGMRRGVRGGFTRS